MPPLSCAHGEVSWTSQPWPSAEGNEVTALVRAMAASARARARAAWRRTRIAAVYASAAVTRVDRRASRRTRPRRPPGGDPADGVERVAGGAAQFSGQLRLLSASSVAASDRIASRFCVFATWLT